MGKRTLFFVLVVVVLGALAWWGYQTVQPSSPDAPAEYVPAAATDTDAAAGSGEATTSAEVAPLAIIGRNLEIPWDVLFLPDGELLVTERPGTVVLLTEGTEILIDGVRHIGEGGLLGAALHPTFDENRFVYLYQTTDVNGGLRNRIVRYELIDDDLRFDRVIFDDIPGARYHDGGRIAFGPDGLLYVTVGDAGEPNLAQDPTTLHGSILRITPEGAVPADNPFDNAVYSYGHRNPQGLAWDEAGNLWSSEHGRSGLRSGFDEINLIEKGRNYGWPDSQGNEVAPGTIGPVRHSGADTTWAPGSIAYHEGSLYVAGLRGAALYEAELSGTDIVAWHEHFTDEYGRLRTVTVGPDELLYLTTSNRDGRGGTPPEMHDLLLRIDLKQLTR